MQRRRCPSREIGRKPSHHSRNKCRYSYGKILVDLQLVKISPAVKPDKSSQRSIQERHPVTTELYTETAAGQRRSGRSHKLIVITRTTCYLLQLLLILLCRKILSYRLESQMTYRLDGSKINTILHPLLKLRKRMSLITIIHHKNIMVDKQMQILLSKTQEQRRPDHIPANPVGISRTLQQKLSRT